MSGLRDAVGFLTRVPVRSSGSPSRIAVRWFPVVGAGVGGLAAVVYAGVYQLMPSPLAALIAVTVGVLVTGAFHEDGFADTADALGSRQTGESGLEIMRDSRLGTYGVLAIVVSMVWRVLAVGALDPFQAVAGLVMAHTFGRAAAVALMRVSPPARTDGLGRAGVLGVTTPDVVIAIAFGVVVAGAAGGWWMFPSMALAGLCLLWVRAVAVSRFGGITGDVLGACEQLVEIAVLTVVVVVTWGGSEVWWTG